jgi:hypothetical protein
MAEETRWRGQEGIAGGLQEQELSESSVEIPYSRDVPLHDSHALVDVRHASMDRLIGLRDGTEVRPNPRG